MSELDWTDINSKLPFSREEEETERRKEIWADIDVGHDEEEIYPFLKGRHQS